MGDRLNLRHSGSRRRLWVIGSGAAVLIVVAAGTALVRYQPAAGRMLRLRQYWSDPAAHHAWMIQAGARCRDAPFLLPTSGYIGFLWHDSFQLGHIHQGVDIFGPNGLGQTPVVAAFDGYLTRLPDWHSAVIVRVPSDPLLPGRQIWTYYTHMADAQGRSFIAPEYPPGTSEMFVRAGTLLGYQGDYSGDPSNPVGMHLHFSIVQDDGQGSFKNELDVSSTIDPSRYLGIPLDARHLGDGVAVCPHPEG